MHKDSGIRCCVAHYNPDGSMAPPCIRCPACHEWIRPNGMQKECKPDEGDDWEMPPVEPSGLVKLEESKQEED